MELRDRRNPQGFRGPGQGRHQIPSDPVSPGQEYRGVRGNRGRTRLTNNVELDPSQAMLRLAAPLAAPRIKAAVAQNLGELRLILERGQRASVSLPG